MNMSVGKIGEKAVMAVLRRAGIECKLGPQGKFYDYDIECTFEDLRFTVEVKFDVMAAKTGNIAIETRNSFQNTPSGIEATKADIWTIVLKELDSYAVFITTVPKLKAFIKQFRPLREIPNAGDCNANILLYREDFILSKIFTRIDGESEASVIATLTKLLPPEKLNAEAAEASQNSAEKDNEGTSDDRF